MFIFSIHDFNVYSMCILTDTLTFHDICLKIDKDECKGPLTFEIFPVKGKLGYKGYKGQLRALYEGQLGGYKSIKVG